MDWQDGFGFPLDEETQFVQQTARSFAQGEVKPLSEKIDREHYFPKELIPKMGQLGFMGAVVPEAYGGTELSQVAYCLAVEELSAACASTGIIVSAHNSLALAPLVQFGSEEQKKIFLPKLSTGEWLGCFALSEPGSGSDAAGMTCGVKKEGNKYILNGTKNWVTNGPEAQIAIVFANLDFKAGHKGICAFIVPLDTAGIQRGKKEDKLGICGSPTCSLSFDGVVVPESNLLGAEGEGFKVAMNTLNGGRLGVAAQAIGIARAALNAALAYSKERKSFGKIIGEHQSVQNYLAEMITQIDAARYLTLGAAARKDRSLSYIRQAAMAKLFASEAAMYCASKGIQIHGGYGYVKEFAAERFLRDAKITEIYEGTSEIQKLVIASHLLRES